jgi:hypothetical protein
MPMRISRRWCHCLSSNSSDGFSYMYCPKDLFGYVIMGCWAMARRQSGWRNVSNFLVRSIKKRRLQLLSLNGFFSVWESISGSVRSVISDGVISLRKYWKHRIERYCKEYRIIHYRTVMKSDSFCLVFVRD